jgi:hypothetical protein
VQRVLEADAGVEAPADRVFEEHPRGLTVAVLQPWGRDAEPVQCSVDVRDQPDSVGGAGFDGLDQDPGDPPNPDAPSRSASSTVQTPASMPTPASTRASMSSFAPVSERLTDV